MPKKSAKFVLRAELCLFFIFLYGMKLRHARYSHDKGLWCKGTNCDVDGYLEMSVNLFKGDWAALADYRPTQILYPILLSPIHLFALNEGKYIYALHTLMIGGTLLFVYLSAKKLYSKGAGLLAAFLIALSADMVVWFNWMFTEYLYYFLISLFIYLTICTFQRVTKSKFRWLCFSFVPLFITKPESLAVFFPVFVCGIYQVLFEKKYSPCKAKTWIFSFVLGLVLLGIAGLTFLPDVRNTLFSHIHVAHGFWLSTHTGEKMNETEQESAYTELAKWSQDKHFKNIKEHHLGMSNEGLRLIQADPLKHLRHIAKRFAAVLFTWNYALGWDVKTKVKDAVYTLFILWGTFFSLLIYGRKEKEVGVLFASAFSMTAFVACYHLDGDFKFRLPIHILLALLGSVGWMGIFDYCWATMPKQLTSRKENIV